VRIQWRKIFLFGLAGLFSIAVFQNCEEKNLQTQASKKEDPIEEDKANGALHIAADNAAFIYFNNKQIGSVFSEQADGSSSWMKSFRFPLEVIEGENVLAIMAVNHGRTTLNPNNDGPAAILAVLDLGEGRYIASSGDARDGWRVSTYSQRGWSTVGFDDTVLNGTDPLWHTPTAYGHNGDLSKTWGVALLNQTGSALITGFPAAVANELSYIWSATNSHDSEGNYVQNGAVDNIVYFRLKFFK
jgi:hypothetical protein